MVFRQHVPSEPLARYVAWFWFFDELYPPHRREHVLPDGTFELIIDLRDQPRRLFGHGGNGREKLFRRAWMSGAHSQYIVIDALAGASMIGVHFKPGGAAAILGMPADELRDQVVELDAMWGPAASRLRDELLAARGPQAKFALLERWLRSRLDMRKIDTPQQQRARWIRDRLVAAHPAPIGELALQLGISHKHLIEEFRHHVGLTPKLFCRIQRFQRVLTQLATQPKIEWADVAYTCGYFDQAHFAHDFRVFSGFRPTDYLSRRTSEDPNFVPLDEGR